MFYLYKIIMKHLNKRNLKNGVITGSISLILMFVIALIWFGLNDLFYNQENRFILIAFVPVWAFLIGLCGYYFSKKFYLQKNNLLGEDYTKASTNMINYWNNYKKLIFANILSIVGKICLLIVPIYILAYLDESKYLSSNLPFIIIIFIIGVSAFILGRHLKIRYEKNNLANK